MLKIFLIVFVISMIPLIELRGAIPVGVALVSSFLGLGEESLSVKYIDNETFDMLKTASTIEKSYEEKNQQDFLSEF